MGFCGKIRKLSLLPLQKWSFDFGKYFDRELDDTFRISSVIRHSFLSFHNNPKNLDKSYKMDLDFGIVLEW